MMATLHSHRAAREQLERDAIRLLCSDLITPETRMRLAEMLTAHKFAADLNRVVFEAIVEVRAVSARRLRELLPGRVTNLGFPDFELQEYLGRNGATDDIDKLFESLLKLTDSPSERSDKAMGQSA